MKTSFVQCQKGPTGAGFKTTVGALLSRQNPEKAEYRLRPIIEDFQRAHKIGCPQPSLLTSPKAVFSPPKTDRFSGRLHGQFVILPWYYVNN